MIQIEHKGEWMGNECTHTITIKGHANYAPIDQDIVCAGVSTLAYTLRARLTEMDAWELNIKDKGGCMTISCVSTPHDHDIEEAIRFAMTGFSLLQEHYPKYVKVLMGV